MTEYISQKKLKSGSLNWFSKSEQKYNEEIRTEKFNAGRYFIENFFKKK